jgi:putative transposase
MATGRMDLNAFVGKRRAAQDGDVRREGMRVLAQALMEGEGAGLIGAERHERTSERAGYRNGSRLRTWDTRVGTIELAIPKIRPGRYFPSLLEPRRRAARARLAVGQAASVPGVSTRTGDDRRKALGLDGMSKSEVARLWTERDTEVEACRRRPLTDEPPSRWLEATDHTVRPDGRGQRMATVVAIGGTADGERPGRGGDAGPSADAAFWTRCLRRLVTRGRRGGRLGIADAPEGRKQARGPGLKRGELGAGPRALPAESARDGAAWRARTGRRARPDALRAAGSPHGARPA